MSEPTSRPVRTLRFPVVAADVRVIRRSGDDPGLVKAADATAILGAPPADRDWLTYAQVVELLPDPPTDAQAAFLAWLRPRLGASTRTSRRDPRTTRYGWQPLRQLLRDRGLTPGRLAAELNEPRTSDEARRREREGHRPVPVGNVAAAAVGAVLPRRELVDYLVATYGDGPEAYFHSDVLEAVAEREARRARRDAALRRREERRQAERDGEL